MNPKNTQRYGYLKRTMSLNAGHGKIAFMFTFPAGTRCLELPQETDSAKGKFWIDDLSTIPVEHFARHDAIHHGIVVDEADVDTRVPAALFHYMYRDTGNHKFYGSVIFRNPEALSVYDIFEDFQAASEDSTFVAEQVGLPTLFPFATGEEGPEDHGLHEIVELHGLPAGEEEKVITTPNRILDPRTLREFRDEFVACKGRWESELIDFGEPEMMTNAIPGHVYLFRGGDMARCQVTSPTGPKFFSKPSSHFSPSAAPLYVNHEDLLREITPRDIPMLIRREAQARHRGLGEYADMVSVVRREMQERQHVEDLDFMISELSAMSASVKLVIPGLAEVLQEYFADEIAERVLDGATDESAALEDVVRVSSASELFEIPKVEEILQEYFADDLLVRAIVEEPEEEEMT